MILDYLFEKFTEKNPPVVNMNGCINRFSKDIKCGICQDSCSFNAVKVKDKSVVFDEKLCNNCGICRAECPTAAIKIKGTGESGLFNNSSEKNNIVFSCTMEATAGNLKISCLNAIHPELIAALIIFHRDKKIHFNLSGCASCELGFTDSIFMKSFDKALKFTHAIGIKSDYEIHRDEEKISQFVDEEISRRDLFKLIKAESGKVAAKTISVITDGEDSLPVRRLLLKVVSDLDLEVDTDYTDLFWYHWNVSEKCDGCKKCESVCPGNAWKVENEDGAIKIYNRLGSCFKCGLCEKNCPKGAISKSFPVTVKLNEYDFKREIALTTCSACGKQFISEDSSKEQCKVCIKKELLRKKISSASNSN